MTAQQDFHDGIAALGLLADGTPINRTEARTYFERATAHDPSMCDAWVGRAAAGEASSEVLQRAYETSPKLWRETRRLGLPDSALNLTINTPAFLEFYPCTDSGLALAYLSAIITERQYDRAEQLLDELRPTAESGLQAVHRYLGASLYYRSRRWPQVLEWTALSVPNVDDVTLAATNLLTGIAETGLGNFQDALTSLNKINKDLTPETIYAEASLYRGLCERRLGNEQAALRAFRDASVGGDNLPDAAAALKDATYGPITTTAEAIAARTDRWDPTTGPSQSDIDQAQQRHEAEQVLAEAQAELDNFIGLTRVKSHVNKLKNVQIFDMGMAARNKQIGGSRSLNMTLVGPPGTAKTSIGRILCKMYFGLGILQSAEFLEVSRKELVGAHIGETEEKTSQWLEKAKGKGILIDEAPDLYKPDNERDFGHIALDTIMKFAEDHRTDTMIALAGYAQPMSKMLGANPGLPGRFPHQIEFDSNTPDEVTQICQLFARLSQVEVDPTALESFRFVASWLYNNPAIHPLNTTLLDDANNGRYARNVLEQSVDIMKDRVITSGIDLATIDIDDPVLSTIIDADITTAITSVLNSVNIKTPTD